MFSYISINWRAKPLTSYQVMIDLIQATSTRTGLKIYPRLDSSDYQTKLKVSDDQLAAVRTAPDVFHPAWNYTVTSPVNQMGFLSCQ